MPLVDSQKRKKERKKKKTLGSLARLISVARGAPALTLFILFY